MFVMVMVMVAMMGCLGKGGARAQHEDPHDHECSSEFVHKNPDEESLKRSK